MPDLRERNECTALTRIVTSRSGLDFDDISTEIRQQHRARWTGKDSCEVKNPDVL